MKLKVKNLAVESNSAENKFHFTNQSHRWVQDVVHRIEKKGCTVEGILEFDLNLTNLEPNYHLSGKLSFTGRQNCSRCVEECKTPILYDFAVTYSQVSPEKREALCAMEGDVNYFQGPEIDLDPVLEEQIFLSLPYRALCRPDCKGICQNCGQNLNQAQCPCENNKNAMNPFGELKSVIS